MNLTGIDLNPIKVQNAVPVPSQRIWILVRATPCGAVGCVSSRCTCISRLGASWVDSFRRFAAEQSADLPGVGTDVFFFFETGGEQVQWREAGKSRRLSSAPPPLKGLCAAVSTLCQESFRTMCWQEHRRAATNIFCSAFWGALSFSNSHSSN